MSTQLEFKASGHVEVDGARVPYGECGEPDPTLQKLSVVALGGLQTSHDHWGPLPGKLDRHVIAVDIPEGYDHPRNPTIAGYTRYMAQAALTILEERYNQIVPFDLVSWSWGTLPAQEMGVDDLPSYGWYMDALYAKDIAVSSLTKVNRSVLMAGIPLGITMKPWWPSLSNLQAWEAIGKAQRNGCDPESMYGPIEPGCEEMLQTVMGRDIDVVSQDRQVEALMQMVMSGSLALRNTMSRNFGRGADTLVLHGRRDRLMPGQLVRDIAHAARMDYKEVEGSHLHPLENVDRTADIVEAYFSQPKRRAIERELAIKGFL